MTPTQSTSGQSVGASSISLTLNGVTAGHTLVLAVTYNDTSGSASAPTTPSGMTNAVNPAPVVASSLSMGCSIFKIDSASAGTNTVTMNSLGGGATLYATASLTEWPFAATPLDQTASPGTSQGASTTSGSTPTTSGLAQSPETVISGVSIGAGTGLANAGISNAPAGNTALTVNQNTQSQNGGEICYRDSTSSAGQATTWSWTSDSTQLGSMQVIAAFKQSGGGGGAIQQTLMMMGVGS